MSRKDTYNPILRYLKNQSESIIPQLSNKSLSAASSKQIFFSVKKKNNRKISHFANQRFKQNDKIQHTQQHHTYNDFVNQHTANNQSFQMLNTSILLACNTFENYNNYSGLTAVDNLSQKTQGLLYNNSKKSINQNNFPINLKSCTFDLDNFDIDDVKTNSTKSYQTHDDIQKPWTNNKKLINSQNIRQILDFQCEEKEKTHSRTVNPHKIYNAYEEIHEKINNTNYFKQKNEKSNQVILAFRSNLKKKISPFAGNNLKISHFQLSQKPIGMGTYSKVYKAIHRKTGMICALKLFDKKKITELRLVNNLIEQIKIMLLSQHENVAKIWGFFQQGHHFYIIMEYCTDGELYKLIKNFQQKNKLSLSEYKKKLNYLKQLCQAVEFLHDHNIMHRDIKPENILLTMGNNAKLTDFGWAKIIRNEAEELRKTFCGTPLYLAPQQIQQHQYNKSIDLWAIGILSFELFTGKIPFTIESFDDLNKIVHEQINYKDIQCFPHAKQFISILLQKDGQKRNEAMKISEHKIFEFLEELDEKNFLYGLEFGRIV